MPKNKGKQSSKKEAAAPKCSCDDPYKCNCGNRPPRPSKGHKWDPETQAWGGKGHKQKGASGQTSSIGQQAKTTKTGGTQIAQWQKLPSTLLQEYCQKQKRPLPKFKNIEKKPNQYRYRLILPDPKRDAEKDLFFVPAQPVLNEEQAKEEAAILALLELTPSIPHERKLPEPYKTTWLHAVDNKKSTTTKSTEKNAKKGSTNATKEETPQDTTLPPTKPAGGGGGKGTAQASTSLVSSRTFTSKSEQRKQQEERQRKRNARIRHHENIRMANQDHPVFLSAKIREQIQALLRGDFNIADLDADDDEDDIDDQDLDVVQAYVESRLHNEGFTNRQARKAFEECKKKSDATNTMNNEDEWESIYEGCLQWLCIHLDEDQLPEGFDPRGGTLDVIVPTSSSSGAVASKTNAATESSSDENKEEVVLFASKYGTTRREASLVLQKAASANRIPEDYLYTTFQSIANVPLTTNENTVTDDSSEDVIQEEMEVLEAMFPSECQRTNTGDLTTITVTLSEFECELTIVLRNGKYPSERPLRVLVSSLSSSGKNSASSSSLDGLGSKIHVETVQFIETLSLGDPMVYEIFGCVQNLLQSCLDDDDAKDSVSLLPMLDPAATANRTPSQEKTSNNKVPSSKTETKPKQQQQQQSVPTTIRKQQPVRRRRRRDGATFWSMSPEKTPAAINFPNIGKAMETARRSLPAYKARADFLKLLEQSEKSGRVILVTGDTGCGKTTQIPQFILEEQPDHAKIVVAQPRRLAATGVAGRVASERGEDQPGTESVGYVVRGDSSMNQKTRLVFCTTGVLLRQLQNEGALENITHIVVDEVHERHLDTDVLLGLLKANLKDYSHLKVVLMSATLDADRFAGYWGKNTPRIHIPGRTFPVQDYMLEDVLSLTGYIPPKKGKKKKFGGYNNNNNQSRKNSSPWADSEKSDEEDEGDYDEEEYSQQANNNHNKSNQNNIPPISELVARVDEANLDYDLLAQLVKHLVLKKGRDDDGSILVFLAGAPEINMAMETIKKVARNVPIQLLPLHGGLQPKDQRIVFQKAGYGITKVILSTNVAETSITIPDCTIVIDSCREKESSYDPSNRMPLLVEQFASQASLKQRRGRAGRVRKGVCYKMVSQGTYTSLREHGEPEIRRCALDQVLLSLLFLGVERGSGTFLKTLMDPPSQESIDAAIFSLQKLGAIESTNLDLGEVALTPLGLHLAAIPAPPPIGKLLVMGSILGCRKAALAMAAGMSLGRSPFLAIRKNFNKRKNENEEVESMQEMKNELILKRRAELFSTVGNSDHALLAAIYMKWEETGVGGGERKRFSESLGLSFTGMRDMLQLVKQLDSSLASAGYTSSNDSDRNMNSWRIIRTCVVAALAPSQLVRVQRPSTKYVATIEGATEKDAEAKELKFFIRSSLEEQQQQDHKQQQQQQQQQGQKRPQQERVFVHPSSATFSVGSYGCPWLVYHSLVRTSKAFLRDATECSAYALLLFGGKITVQADKGVVSVDEWVQLSAKARIGSLIGGLRQKMDELLTRKVADPSFDLASTSEMKLIVKLLVTDGLGS